MRIYSVNLSKNVDERPLPIEALTKSIASDDPAHLFPKECSTLFQLFVEINPICTGNKRLQLRNKLPNNVSNC